jgi:nucleotide-binding universal stress UspA family protein
VHRDSKGSLQIDDRLADRWSRRESAALTAFADPHGTHMDDHNSEGAMMTRILVATDFSEPSLAALRYATALTYSVHGEGLLLHVVEGEPVRRYVVGRQPEAPRYWLDLMADALRPQIPSQVIHHDLFEEAQWKPSALLPPAALNCFGTLVVVGNALKEIVRVAKDRIIDLIMLGEHSRRGLTGLLCRSLAGLVARRVTIPAITVWNSGHVISEQLRVNESMLCGSPSEHHTGKQVAGRKSKATPKRAPLGV